MDKNTGSTFPKAFGKVIPPRTAFRHNGRRFLFDRGWHFQVTECPYCYRQHYHGWPAPDDPKQFGGNGSSRSSHCCNVKVKGTHPVRYTEGGEYILIVEDAENGQ